MKYAPTIVARTSITDILKSLIEWIPLPGSPNIFAYEHKLILINYVILINYLIYF